MGSRKILILGVTASGKSRLGFELAKAIGGEIIVVDSMKVYRRMDIGTAKPSKEAQSQMSYHLIDVVEPSEPFNVGRYVELAQQAVDDIQKRGKDVIAVGGTALYIKAMLYGLFNGPAGDEKIREKLKAQADTEGLDRLHEELRAVDPTAASNIHPNDAKRIIRALEVYEITGKGISSFQNQFDAEPKNDWFVIGLRRKKEIESMRINARVRKMVEAGLVDEVRSLLGEEKPLSRQAACAIGYAEIIEHLNGNTELEDAIESIKINTRRLAKGQRTWFKTFREINWLDIEEEESVENLLKRVVQILNSNI